MASSLPSVSCSICRDNFDEASDTVAIPCGHVFHTRCVGEWLKQSQTCPQCRGRLRNPQTEMTRIFLSFGSSCDEPSEGEPAGLAELRHRLAAATDETEAAKKRLKSLERRDAKLRRDLSQRQRQIDMFSTQLETCQESMTQQAEENSQLMQLLAQEFQEQSELTRLRHRERELEVTSSNLRAEILRLKSDSEGLRSRLEESQREVELLSDQLQAEQLSYSNQTDELLASEAENFDLSKRLNASHEHSSLLADRLRRSEIRVTQLRGKLLSYSATDRSAVTGLELQLGSLPAVIT